jgi:hypothetical protein
VVSVVVSLLYSLQSLVRSRAAQHVEILARFGLAHVATTMDAMNTQAIRTAPRSPWQNADVERVIGSIRRECLDHVLVLKATGLRRQVIRAQFGHVSPAMMAIYSHVRRKASNEAAAALEPEAAPSPAPDEPATSAEGVTSHVTSQSAATRRNVLEFPTVICSDLVPHPSTSVTSMQLDIPTRLRHKPCHGSAIFLSEMNTDNTTCTAYSEK